MLVSNLGGKIWAYNLLLISIRHWNIRVNISNENWRPMFRENEKRRQGSLWEQHVSSWHHEDNYLSFLKQSRGFCTRGSVSYSARIKNKENLSSCLFC